jgi:lipopolysaccharide/colanic/teichoic acid biosynthesis glycosyltransferase
MEYGVFQVRPGLTGYAQIQGRDDLEYQLKAALDAEYVQKCGIKLDLWCLVKTVGVVFTGEGAK